LEGKGVTQFGPERLQESVRFEGQGLKNVQAKQNLRRSLIEASQYRDDQAQFGAHHTVMPAATVPLKSPEKRASFVGELVRAACGMSYSAAAHIQRTGQDPLDSQGVRYVDAAVNEVQHGAA
jgi:hypothetical protein